MTWTPRPGPCPGSCRQPPTAAPVDRFHAARRLLISLLRSGHESGAWAAGVDPVAGVELIIAVVKGALLSPSRAGVVERFHAARRLLISLLRSGHESGAWAAGVDPVAGVELIIAVVKGAQAPDSCP